jgi:ankyrin repeat protein
VKKIEKTDLALELLAKGADPNAANAKKEQGIPPPIIMAVSLNDEKLFDALVNKYKADVNGKDSEGWNALQFSAELGYLEYCK